MRIYFVRHGETDWNLERRLQGQSDIPLNEFGRSLAMKTEEKMREIPFDHVISSPLIRAYETAEILIGNRDLKIEVDERMTEISFGEFEGLCCAEEGYNIPDPDFIDFFKNPEQYGAPKGGETILEFQQRLQAFMTELYQNEKFTDRTILIAAHGATIRGILSWIKGNSLKDFWQGGVHKNCAVSIVDYDGNQATIVEDGIVLYDDEVENYLKM